MFTDIQDMFPLVVSIGILFTVFCLAIFLRKPKVSAVAYVPVTKEPCLTQHVPYPYWISHKMKRQEAPEEDPDHFLPAH